MELELEALSAFAEHPTVHTVGLVHEREELGEKLVLYTVEEVAGVFHTTGGFQYAAFQLPSPVNWDQVRRVMRDVCVTEHLRYLRERGAKQEEELEVKGATR